MIHCFIIYRACKCCGEKKNSRTIRAVDVHLKSVHGRYVVIGMQFACSSNAKQLPIFAQIIFWRSWTQLSVRRDLLGISIIMSMLFTPRGRKTHRRACLRSQHNIFMYSVSARGTVESSPCQHVPKLLGPLLPHTMNIVLRRKCTW